MKGEDLSLKFRLKCPFDEMKGLLPHYLATISLKLLKMHYMGNELKPNEGDALMFETFYIFYVNKVQTVVLPSTNAIVC